MSTYSGEVPADEVLQDATPDRVVVPVTVETPVDVRELPRIGGGAWTDTLDTAGKRVLTNDPKRAVVTIVSLDQAIYYGHDQGNVSAAAGTPNGALWPANTPLVLTHTEEVFLSSSTSTSRVTIIVERWAR